MLKKKGYIAKHSFPNSMVIKPKVCCFLELKPTKVDVTTAVKILHVDEISLKKHF